MSPETGPEAFDDDGEGVYCPSRLVDEINAFYKDAYSGERVPDGEDVAGKAAPYWKAIHGLTETIRIVCEHPKTPSHHKQPLTILFADLDPLGIGRDGLGEKGDGWRLRAPSGRRDVGIRLFDQITPGKIDDYGFWTNLDPSVTVACGRCKKSVSWRHRRQAAAIGQMLDVLALQNLDTMTLETLRRVVVMNGN